MLRRERPALLVLFGMAAFALIAPAPRFESSLALVATALCVLLGDPRDPRAAVESTRARRWLLMYTPLAILGLAVTRPAWSAAEPFVGLDGRVNEAILGELLDQAARGRPLEWLTRASPGDPTLDLYPTLAHRALAWLARVTGHERETARFLVTVVSAVYVGVSIGIARTAVRVGAPLPAALAIGAFALLDVGTDFTWGTRPVFRYGFLPSTLSVAALLHTLPSLLDLARRPTRARLAFATLGCAITAALHPLALAIVLVLAVVLALSVAGSPPAARRRSLTPLLATVLGVASSAFVWLPASRRVLAYGVHYGAPQIPVDLAALRMALGALPDGGWMIVIAAAWLVGLVAITTPGRPEARWLAWVSLLLVLSYVETPFVELGLAPTEASVRWQAFRVGAAVKPLSYVLGALAIGQGARLHALAVGHPARERALRVAAAAAIVALAMADHRSWAVGLRDLERARAADIAGPASSGAEDLAALRYRLAIEQRERPGGRLLLVCGLECVGELYRFARDAADGTPGIALALSQPAPAGWLLRDQLRTTTPENLRRFGIRWTVAPDRSLLAGADLGEDRRFGRLWLRPVPSWDGAIAHVARGSGTVRAALVPGEGLDVTLEGTDQPALVELGTPYYPRLIATDERGRDVPVYALPVRLPAEGEATPSIEHATALWLAPGTTRVRASGALPSDGSGAPASALAIACLLWLSARPRAGARIGAWLARRLAWRGLGLVALTASLAMAVGLVGRARSLPVDTLRLAATAPRARVFVIDGAGRRSCASSLLGRTFECPDGATLRTSVSYSLRDWHVGWPVPAPAIELTQGRRAARYLVELDGQSLEGPYFAQCEGCRATLREADGSAQASVEDATARLTVFVDAPRLELRPSAPTATFTLVAARVLDPPFTHPLPPPEP